MTKKRTPTINASNALSFQTASSFGPAMTRPVDRRLFLKGAALSLFGLTVLGIDSVALGASASEETLNALSDAQAEYEAAMATLASYGSQLEEAEYKLAECQANLDATNEQISELSASIVEKQQELSDAQDVLAERVSATYRVGNANLLSVLLDATSFEDFINRLYYANKIADADAEAIQAVKDLKAELEAEEAALQEQRALQEQLLSEQQTYTDELSSIVASYQAYTASLSSEVAALMEQAQAELLAAQQAEYEAYLAEQEAQANSSSDTEDASSDGGETSAGDASVSNTTGEDTSSSSDSSTGTGTPSGGSDTSGSDTGASSGGSDTGTGDSGASSSSDAYESEQSSNEESSQSSYSGGNHVPAVADIAWNYIGVPYVWGGTDPSGFDCSGLTQYCYAQAGYSIGRDTYAQAANISAKGQMTYSMSDLQAGDLVFPHAGHVGIYMGGGMMIHSPYPGTTVQYASVYAFSFGGCPV